MPKLPHLLAVAALAAVAATPVAARDKDRWAREANDRAEIQALMWRYERALDTLDVDAYVAVFTEDATFGKAKGREGIRALIAGIKAAREKNTEPGKPVTPTYQSITNMNIEFVSETRAVINGYYMALLGTQPPRVATVGLERDEVVKVDGHWLIAVRTVSP
ncbi:MAG TPA: nuclear transport factor 2 family protein [Gammaproteobacteria bacterium]|nr:nuclear transport factor 2 family protein [Gammaproteobacteria bacterium]